LQATEVGKGDIITAMNVGGMSPMGALFDLKFKLLKQKERKSPLFFNKVLKNTKKYLKRRMSFQRV
jgi:hypothetical protein